jgi:hypothetical protein
MNANRDREWTRMDAPRGGDPYPRKSALIRGWCYLLFASIRGPYRPQPPTEAD